MRKLLIVWLGLWLAGLGWAQNQVWNMATPYPDGNFHTINRG